MLLYDKVSVILWDMKYVDDDVDRLTKWDKEREREWKRLGEWFWTIMTLRICRVKLEKFFLVHVKWKRIAWNYKVDNLMGLLQS